MGKVKIIVLKQEIMDTYHVHNSDGGHLEWYSCIYTYIVSDKQFEISYNEAACLKKYDCQWKDGYRSYPDDDVNSFAFDYNPIKLNLNFNKRDDWESYCKGFHMEEHFNGDTGTEQSWEISKETTSSLLDELSELSPNKFSILEVNCIEELIKENRWLCYFLYLDIENVYNKYLAESRAGCNEIKECIYNKKVQIREYEEKIETLKKGILDEQNNLKRKEQENLIKLLCENKLNYTTAFPPTIGFENVSPIELALCSGNKELFIKFYEESIFENENDALFLLLKYGLFEEYYKVKNKYSIYKNHERDFKWLHIFYSVYNLNWSELDRILNEYRYEKSTILQFFSTQYKNIHLPSAFESMPSRIEIKKMISKDFRSKSQEWANNILNGNTSLFESQLEEIEWSLIWYLEEIEEYKWSVDSWFYSRLNKYLYR